MGFLRVALRPAPARSPHRPSGQTNPSNANPTLPAGPARRANPRRAGCRGHRPGRQLPVSSAPDPAPAGCLTSCRPPPDTAFPSLNLPGQSKGAALRSAPILSQSLLLRLSPNSPIRGDSWSRGSHFSRHAQVAPPPKAHPPSTALIHWPVLTPAKHARRLTQVKPRVQKRQPHHPLQNQPHALRREGGKRGQPAL